jgi:hypothetical protein
MNEVSVGKTYLGGELDSEISKQLQPGEIEVFLSEGVQHLQTDSSGQATIKTKKVCLGVSNT